jgi:hypothetical protein
MCPTHPQSVVGWETAGWQENKKGSIFAFLLSLAAAQILPSGGVFACDIYQYTPEISTKGNLKVGLLTLFQLF